MPFSTPIFKRETFEFLKNKYGPTTTVLDLGAGCGTYSSLFKLTFPNMDAVEIHQPYIVQYDLKKKYNTVYNENALTFEFDYYDIIILGDILEHIEEQQGIELIKKLYNKCSELVIGIPYNSEQGVHFDNVYEIHLQANLTNESFLKKYDGFRPLALRYDYGIYVKNNKANQKVKVSYDIYEGPRIQNFDDNLQPVYDSTPTVADIVESKPESAYKTVFSNIYETYGFGGTVESRSGYGSTLEETAALREKIKTLVREKNIKSVVDIPCGDFNWMKEIVFSFETYTGGDIVEKCIQENKERYSNSRIKFVNFDLVTDEIPTADLLIVRDVLGHFPIEDGEKIIKNILKSGCKYLLSTTWYNLQDKDYSKKHLNRGAGHGGFYPINLMSKPFNFPEPDTILEENIRVDDHEIGTIKALGLWDLQKVKEHFTNYEFTGNVTSDQDLTIVTGLWNIGRPDRNFDRYIDHFNNLLDIDANLFIYIPQEYEYLVWAKRRKYNTYVKIFELNDIKTNIYQPHWDKTQEIRTNPEWFNSTGEGGWLKGSPQAILEWYNPIVQSKMFMLHSATIWNPFNAKKFIWLDAGITNTVYEKYFTENNVLNKISDYIDPFLFLSYPYEAADEVHGFKHSEMKKICGKNIEYVCRGGLFGGTKEAINEASSEYYTLLQSSLSQGLMGTEESIFTMMAYLFPQKYRRYALDGNGLVVKFIQNLLSDNIELEPIPEQKTTIPDRHVNTSKLKVSVYMLTFNFPHQVEHTIKTWLKHDKWITNTRNILIDNSTNEEARLANAELCKNYNFEHIITNENTGINGGRFRAAQHFQESDSDYYLFLEDDMGAHEPGTDFCRNGFRTYVPDLYDTVLKIIHGSKVDFLKLSYTEVYMDNNIQVSWYNVPQQVRTKEWPDYDRLPETGLDLNTPRTQFNNIEVVNGVSYISGEIYYANWPTVVGKIGNQKMFLDTTWARPYEQTWMSYMYQETKKGNLKPAILLASPIHHNRIAHYSPEERREN